MSKLYVLASMDLPQVPDMSLTLLALFISDVSKTIAVITFNEFCRMRQTYADGVWDARPGEHSCNITLYSTKKRASRATALRADGLPYTRPLLVTHPISPTPWTRPQRSQS